MGRAIVKVGIGFCEWSTVVDAPISEILLRDETPSEWTSERVDRAEARGHSFHCYPPDHEFWKDNRAGPREGAIKTLGRMYAVFGSRKLKDAIKFDAAKKGRQR